MITFNQIIHTEMQLLGAANYTYMSLGIPYFNSQTSPKNSTKFGKEILPLELNNPHSF